MTETNAAKTVFSTNGVGRIGHPHTKKSRHLTLFIKNIFAKKVMNNLLITYNVIRGNVLKISLILFNILHMYWLKASACTLLASKSIKEAKVLKFHLET